MEFHSWQTMIDEFKKVNAKDKSLRGLSDKELFDIEMKNIQQSNFKDPSNKTKRTVRLMMEYLWMRQGRPYYNIHPQLVSSLCKTNLDKIPASFIEMPNKFKNVCFRFSNPIPTRYTDNNGVSLVVDDTIQDLPIYCRSALFTIIDVNEASVDWLKQNKVDLSSPHFQGLAGSKQLNIFIDEGFRLKYEDVDRLMCNNISLIIKPEQTIPEAIEENLRHLQATSPERYMFLAMGDRLTNLFRVIISAGFLANTPEEGLVVPDVLTRDKDAYIAAVNRGDQEKMEEIVTRAKNRDKFGYNVGTNEMFVGERELTKRDPSSITGRELEYSHIRGGHPHAVRYGEGKKLVKIKWYRPTRIREDLPFRIEETE
jgi:hypothetical protein